MSKLSEELIADSAEHVKAICGADAIGKLEMIRRLTADQVGRVEQADAALDVLNKAKADHDAGAEGQRDPAALLRAVARILSKLHTDAWMVHEMTLDMLKAATRGAP